MGGSILGLITMAVCTALVITVALIELALLSALVW